MKGLAAPVARLRVPLGFAFGAAALWLAQPTVRTVLAGALIAGAGEALRVWAAGHLIKSQEVTSSGPYHFVAHPLYVGSAIMGAGVAVGCNSLMASGLVAAYLVVTMTAAIRSERAFLRKQFGEQYERYRRRLDRGRSSDGAPPGGGRRFSFDRAVANHEPRAIVGLGVAILLLLAKATYNGTFWGAAGR